VVSKPSVRGGHRMKFTLNAALGPKGRGWEARGGAGRQFHA
jgi:hypothetical protein